MAKQWDFRQELVGCFGKPLSENPTQYMMESAFKHHGLNWRYINIETGPEDLGPSVRALKPMGFRGGNCTLPYKVKIIEHLDRLGESAALMGAVNCLVWDGDELVGENSDGKGFLQSLREVADPAGKTVVILGAGGAARAIAVELGLAGASRITIVNRTPSRGEELAGLLTSKVKVEGAYAAWEGDYQVPDGTDILINATSIGMFPDRDARIPLAVKTLKAGMIVADVIVNPPDTRLLRDARDRGCTALDGLGMVINQAIIAFKYWTDVDADPSVMRKALEEVFELS